MPHEKVAFDGRILTDDYLVEHEPIRPVLSRRVITESSDSLDGARFSGVNIEQGECSARVWIFSDDAMERRRALRELMSILGVPRPRPLWFEDDGDLYYMAIPGTIAQNETYDNAICVEVSFVIPDTRMYGKVVKMGIPSGAKVGVLSECTAEVAPRIECAHAVRSSDSKRWGLRLDDGMTLRVELPDDDPHALVIDCASRVCTVDGLISLIDVNTDWIELTPGRHVIEHDQGTGSCDISWQERWL